jgi:endonuclease III-like uncharacterized protein
MAPTPRLPRPHPARRRLLRLYDRLRHRYGPPRVARARSRLEVIVEAILTQNASARNAERAIARLRAARALDLPALLALSSTRLAASLGPSATARGAAGRLRAFAAHVAGPHGSRLPRLLARPLPALRAELREIAGLADETADAIALHAAGRPIAVADRATRRVLVRHRLVAPEADAATVQAFLMTHLPHDPALFREFRASLGRVAEEHCRRGTARCEGCPLRFDLRGRAPRG